MWLVALITILNACLNNDWSNDTARIQIAGLPVNIFDFALVIAFLWTFLPGLSTFATTRVSRVALVTLLCSVSALTIGVLNSLTLMVPGRSVITDARNFGMVFLAVFIGYRATRTLSSALFYCYVVILSGVLVSSIIPFDFAHGAETLTRGQQVDSVRIIQYCQYYGAITAGFLIFCLGFRGKPPLPRWLSLLLIAYCVVGTCATLSRSDWVATAMTVLAGLTLMPRINIGRKVMISVLAVPVLICFALGGMYAAQQISGRDVYAKVSQRLWSIMGYQSKGVASAEASRLPAVILELQAWGDTPASVAVGRGYGIITQLNQEDFAGGGHRHNSWVGELVETGLLGFGSFALMIFGQIVMGRKMIKRRLDRRTVLVGAMAVVTGVHAFSIGAMTMAFNQVRWGLPAAIMFGVLLRTREIERTLTEMYVGYLPDPNDPATPPVPLIDAGARNRSPQLLIPAAGQYHQAGEYVATEYGSYAH